MFDDFGGRFFDDLGDDGEFEGEFGIEDEEPDDGDPFFDSRLDDPPLFQAARRQLMENTRRAAGTALGKIVDDMRRASDERARKRAAVLPREAMWRMINGHEIPVSEMDDRHVMNSILMLERNARALKLKATARFMFGMRRDAMDLDGDNFNELVLEALEELMDISPLDYLVKRHAGYKILYAEATKRGLLVIPANQWFESKGQPDGKEEGRGNRRPVRRRGRNK